MSIIVVLVVKMIDCSMWKMSLICKLIGLGLTKHESWQGSA